MRRTLNEDFPTPHLLSILNGRGSLQLGQLSLVLIVHLSQLYCLLSVTVFDDVQLLLQAYLLRPQLEHALHETRFFRLELVAEF